MSWRRKDVAESSSLRIVLSEDDIVCHSLSIVGPDFRYTTRTAVDRLRIRNNEIPLTAERKERCRQARDFGNWLTHVTRVAWRMTITKAVEDMRPQF